MTVDSVLQRTRTYITENFLYMRKDLQLGDADSLLERGVIDSMGVMELVQFLEKEFGIHVKDDDITEENLGTLAAIAKYVAGKG